MDQIFSIYEKWLMGSDVRLKSNERDFGVWWKLEGDPIPYRVSWVEDTGELYAVNKNQVIVLKVISECQRVYDVMTGWEILISETNSLNKLQERLQFYGS